MTEAETKAAPDPVKVAREALDFEEALRLCEIGEYLYSVKAYSYGDGYTEPREYGIEWQWQQSKPNEYGQGVLLAEAAKWHEQQAEDGTLTEAAKLRAALPRPAPEAKEAAPPAQAAASDGLVERMRELAVKQHFHADMKDIAEAAARIEADAAEKAAKDAEIRRLKGTLTYIAAQATAGYPTVLSVIKANAKAALDDDWQKTISDALTDGGGNV